MSDTPQDPKQPNQEAIAAANAISSATKNKMVFALSEEAGEKLEKAGYTGAAGPLMYALEQATGSAGPKKAPALAFTENPAPSDNYLGLYKSKRRLLPDEILKQIRVQDHLIAAILRARGSMMSLFGNLQKDRFDVGIEVKIKDDFQKILTPEQYEKVVARMKRFEQLLLNCGHTEGLEHQDRKTLAEFLDVQSRNGLTFGRFATEVIYDKDGTADRDGNYPFFRFRAIDAATIVRAVRKGEAIGNNLRVTALRALESLTGEKINIDIQSLKEDKYAWLQVIDGTPRQAFTHDEMLVFDLFPSTDIEHNGYPVSPIDTVVSSITTHISIDTYKKLYFQNGRASKGMLVIQSDEVDQATLDNMKLQFNASINSVSNSFRTPIFGIGKEDKVEWLSMIGEGARDADFQFMYDQVARNILSAFSISPDELPGYGHLSKGTNSQTLSECFDPSTGVLTRNGLFSAHDLLDDKKETPIEVWSGKKWEKARLFYTGEKEVRETHLSSNLTIKTSPDHRFRIVNPDGKLVWKHQKDLCVGDTALVNANPISGSEEVVPSYRDKPITPDMMEVLGWMTGDGNVVLPRKRSGGSITLFYHHDKEIDVRNRHANILQKFGIDASMVDTEISEEQAQSIADRYGFNSVSTIRRTISIHSTDLVRWIEKQGFVKDGIKSVPEFIHSSPVNFRTAFLKGLFSADGHATESGSVILTIQEDKARESVRQMLIGLGIRTTSMQGHNRDSFGKKEFSYKLSIKDRNAYWSQIGFIQEHKSNREKQQLWIIDEIPKNILSFLAKKCLDNGQLLSKADRDILVSASNEKRGISKNHLISLAKKTNTLLPEWLHEFHLEKVTKLVDLEETIKMVDVEVFSEEHAFMLSGIQVHNSNNEFKLTAARDTGLRPMILKFQTFFNQRLFPIIDPLLAKICEVKFAGLDAQSKEQESARLQQDMAIHMTYDEVLHESDKDKVGKAFGGEFPFNERYQLILDKYMDVGAIRARFFDDPGSIVDPIQRYKRDPFFIQYLQLLSQINPAAVQAYFAPRPFAMDMLKLNISDMLEE